MAAKNPIKDQIAIVGLGFTEYARSLEGRTPASLAAEASKKAILDAGLKAQDIDGICGSTRIAAVTSWRLQSALGIPRVTWWGDVAVPFALNLAAAAQAVFSGTCTTALVYHAVYRGPGISRAAMNDPFRVRNASEGGDGFGGTTTAIGIPVLRHAGWMNRYLHEYEAKREHFGLVAINNRTNASMNEHAVLRTPITMDDYLSSRMIHDPKCLLDADLPIDGADAYVVTTAERARDLRRKPVYLHAFAFGGEEHRWQDTMVDLQHTGFQIAAEALWQKSDLGLRDMDVYFPYDGFSYMSLMWLESVGYCQKGEGGPFLEQHWDQRESRAKISGRIPLNTHGGSLSEGGTQGAGHLREAVTQLRGEAGRRQVPGCKAALVTPGGSHNACAVILRAG
jgi:acetyl-CoA acetyltransferase